MIDKADRVGHLWCGNHHSVAACDIESDVYMRMLDEMDYIPTEGYARYPEIFAYALPIANKFDLYHRALPQTLVDDLCWYEDACRWPLLARHEHIIRARVVMISTDHMQSVRLYGISSIERFQGHSSSTTGSYCTYTGCNSTGDYVF